MVEKEM